MRGDVNTKIIFLGPPGAGKGTYSTRLARLLDMPRISTGEIFREAIKKDNDLGKQVTEGFILDGYPRTIPQAQALDEVVKIDAVLNLRIHEKILIMKLSARRICDKCGEIYNIIDVRETLEGIEYNMPAMHPKTPGICDKCGGTLIQRKDDRVEVIETRLKLYHQQSEPLVRYYRSRGLVEDISVHLGIDRTISLIMKKLKPHMVIK